MGSHQSTVDYIKEQTTHAGHVYYKKMFGEYAIYCNDKVIALVCDDTLFIKPTLAVKEFLQDYEERSPYPGAKPYLFIEGDKWEDNEWLTELFRLTEKSLPPPKKKKPRKSS